MDSLSGCLTCIGEAVTLVICANGAPVILRNLLAEKWDLPVDLGLTCPDGRTLFGRTKTWRGLIASIITTMVAASLFGLSPITGGLFGFWVMTGDLFGSFIKRRLGLIESSRARMLDIIPESLLPGLMMHRQLGLGLVELIFVVGVFFLLEVLISPILFRLGIRNRPY
jgi:CDP-archaeol synthase